MLSVIILSYRRQDALRRTLRELHTQRIPTAAEAPPHAPYVSDAEVIVMDNASNDGTVEAVLTEFPRVRFLELPENIGVEAFNRGAAIAKGDLLLILDDDAWPDKDSLYAALEALAQEPALSAVALHPRHPTTGASEWAYAHGKTDVWPFMGCGNLIRTSAWNQVGGYEKDFFLYRNDTDLALKLLAAGGSVRMIPAWTVFHDSPQAARKSDRWLSLATRNWVWLCRRHAGFFGRWWPILGGTLWAMKQAGLSPSRLVKVWSGALSGVFSRCPRMPVPRRPEAFKAMMRLQMSRV